MKKILCDIDLIIDGILDEKNQAGLFQTNKFILKELLKNKKLDIYFCTNHYSKKIFFDKLKDKKWNFIDRKKIIFLQSFKQKILCNLEIIKKDLLSKKKNFKTKILRFLISISKKIIKIFLPEMDFSIQKKIKEFDFYKSFYYEIPKFIQKNNRIKKAIFLHDITPVNHPEFHTKIIKKGFNKIIKSIKTDTIIFTNSEYTKNDFIKFFPRFKNNKIIVCPLAVDKRKFYKMKDRKEIKKVLDKYKIPTDKKYFLSLGSMNPRKNLEFVVKGFAKFLDKNPKLKINLVLAGASGWKLDSLLSEIGEKKDRILFTGFVADEDINAIYNGAFVFVYPSLYEGFGLPVLEAMKCGLPCITSKTTSLPEVIGNTGILINPERESELVMAFSKLCSNTKLRNSIAKKALNRAEKFSWKNTIQNIIKEIE